ncbi:MAG: S1 RNA-binding domain-containing protein, partial [Flavobacterium sp.]
TGTTINIEEKNNQGEVSIFGTEKEKVERAFNWVKGIVAVPVEGDEYEATVKSIMPYGAFVEFLPGKQGLLHISEVSWKRLETLEGVLSEGEKIKVKLTGTDPKTGKFKLSRKVLMPKPEGMQERSDRGERNEGGGDRRRDDKPRFENRRDERPQGDRPKLQRNSDGNGSNEQRQQEKPQQNPEAENQ